MRFLINRANRVVERQRFFQTGPLFVWQKTSRDRAVNLVFGTLITGGVIASTAGLASMATGK
ncbi:hypothetical protein BDF22DRAFT_742482 [Syncephalis plumigaleata]|nr:hypothetical protein BDF22DRAFT_742482 [Syncephalis plumigaleata]